MFNYIKGEIAHVEPNLVVIESAGIGFGINTSYSSSSSVKCGDKSQFFTYLHVREDILDLFGFSTREELNCFKMLIGVSGVGPKAALAILSAVTPSKLALCIISDDEKSLTAAPGIGKKIAQRIILELKDKMAKAEIASGDSGQNIGFVEAGAAGEAVAALAVLGYSRAEAAQAISGADQTLPTEELVRLALKKLMR